MVNSSIKTYSLSELARAVRQGITRAFPSPVVVCAEISQLNLNAKSGHCYLDLVEKDPSRDGFIAKLPAVIWRSRYTEIAREFMLQTGMPLAAGISVMATVTVEFNELYGLKLFIESIDPTYTVGDMALRRREIIETLRREGVSGMNRALPLPRLMRRIAVISSETAAGYEDFIHQLKSNSGGYIFYTRLFPAVMQGEQTEESVTAALSLIAADAELYDCAVIIRGGGASADLQAFDSLGLARICAQFPIPVLTGIGHTRDESVVDMVAALPLKTPTAVASFLIEHMAAADSELSRLSARIKDSTLRALADEREWLTRCSYDIQRLTSRRTSRAEAAVHRLAYTLRSAVAGRLSSSRYTLMERENRMKHTAQARLSADSGMLDTRRRAAIAAARRALARERDTLDSLSQKTSLLNPENLLRRGYTLTECGGRIVTSTSQLNVGDTIMTHFFDGNVTSTVDEIPDIRI